MAVNLAQLIPDLMTFINAVISILAFGLFLGAVVKMVAHSKGRDGTRLSTPFLMLLSAVMLWNLGMSVTSMLQTVYGGSSSAESLLSYTDSNNMPEQTNAFLRVLIMFIRVYGYYAFAAGWWKVKNIGAGTQSAEGSVGSAFWHIVGGVAAINIVATVNVVTSTLGFGELL